MILMLVVCIALLACWGIIYGSLHRERLERWTVETKLAQATKELDRVKVVLADCDRMRQRNLDEAANLREQLQALQEKMRAATKLRELALLKANEAVKLLS